MTNLDTSVVIKYAITGIGPLSSARDLANNYKDNKSFQNDEARLDALVNWECNKNFTAGVVTTIASLQSLLAGVAANYLAVLILKARMVAAIACINGYDIDSEGVKTSILLCLNSGSIGEILKDAGISSDQEIVAKQLNALPHERLKAMNDYISQKFATNVGSFVLSAAMNYSNCSTVASNARKIFKRKSLVEKANACFKEVKDSLPFIKKTILDFDALVKDFKGLFSDLVAKDLITYEEVIGLLIEKKPDDPNFTKAIGYLQTTPTNKITITLAFLNNQDQIIDGMKISAKEIDPDLKGLFSKNKLVIFE